jgi:hypothetical protein
MDAESTIFFFGCQGADGRTKTSHSLEIQKSCRWSPIARPPWRQSPTPRFGLGALQRVAQFSSGRDLGSLGCDPQFTHLVRGSCDCVAEDVRVTADHFFADPVGDIGEGESSTFFSEGAVQHNL